MATATIGNEMAPQAGAWGAAQLGGWLLFRPEEVPTEWSHRGVPMVMVPLLPDELGQTLGVEGVLPGVDPEDIPLLRLAARGMTPVAIARELNFSVRTVQRRLSKLCRRFNLDCRSELAAFLAQRGF